MNLLVGRKAICNFLGGISWATVRRWIKEKKLPVVQDRREQPTLLTSHAEEWQRLRLKKNRPS